MLGCVSLAAAFTSRWNRLTASGDFVAVAGSIFEATIRFIRCVLGLVDLAHAPLAELVQHHVVADDQPARLALVNRLRLEPGQPLARNSSCANCLPLCGRRSTGRLLNKCVEFVAAQQAAAGQRIAELGQRHNCLGCILTVRRRLGRAVLVWTRATVSARTLERPPWNDWDPSLPLRAAARGSREVPHRSGFSSPRTTTRSLTVVREVHHIVGSDRHFARLASVRDVECHQLAQGSCATCSC